MAYYPKIFFKKTILNNDKNTKSKKKKSLTWNCMYRFPVAAVTIHHKLNGLKQNKFIIFQNSLVRSLCADYLVPLFRSYTVKSSCQLGLQSSFNGLCLIYSEFSVSSFFTWILTLPETLHVNLSKFLDLFVPQFHL